MLLRHGCYPEKLKFLSPLGLVVKWMAKPQSVQEQKNLGFYSGRCFFPLPEMWWDHILCNQTALVLVSHSPPDPAPHTNQHTHRCTESNWKSKSNPNNKTQPACSEIILARLLLFNKKVVIQCNNTSCMPEQEECYFCVGREIAVMYKRDTVFPTLWPNFTLSFSCQERVWQ